MTDKLKIGIIDADLISRKKHRFPNLACMKISAHHKEHGHEVTLITDYKDLYYNECLWLDYQNAIDKYVKKQSPESAKELGERMVPCFNESNIKFDKIFISKVFTDTEVDEDFLTLDIVEYGGTGFFYDKAAPLPPEIEHIMPDYHLYDDFVSAQIETAAILAEDEGERQSIIRRKRNEFSYYLDYSIGFTTRGCIRGCSFCVNKNYRVCLQHSPVEEFLDPDRKYICLLDDNILSCREWRSVFDQLNATGKRFQFKQGMDERLLTDEKCEVIFSSNWIGDYIFAFDNIKDRHLIEKKLQLMRQHTDVVPKFYVFCGFNHDNPDVYPDGFWENDIRDVFERVKVLMRYKALPYIMRYMDYELSPYRGMYITLARWCNQPSFLKKKSFREFALASGGASERYVLDFERRHPEIAAEYFNMRWSDFDEVRICTACGCEVISGYCIDDGEEYFCSDDCLRGFYSPEEYEELCADDRAYWTDWF